MNFIEDLNWEKIDIESSIDQDKLQRIVNPFIRKEVLYRFSDIDYRDFSNLSLNGISIPGTAFVSVRASAASNKFELVEFPSGDNPIAYLDRYGITSAISSDDDVFILEYKINKILQQWIRLFLEAHEKLTSHAKDLEADMVFVIRKFPTLMLTANVMAIWGRFGGATFRIKESTNGEM